MKISLHFVFFLAVTLTACGGGGGGKKNNVINSSVTQSTSSVNSNTANSSSSSSDNSSNDSSNDSSSSLNSSLSNSSISNSIVTLTAEANPSSVMLDWAATLEKNYTLYIATSPNCEIQTFESCVGKLNAIANAVPGNQSLENGKTYWFQLMSSDNEISNKVFARPDQIVVNNVKAIVADENGTTYLGGDFDRVGLKTGYAAFIDKNTGEAKAFPFVNGPVYASVSDGTGGFYIGGEFTSVGEQSRQGLAHILADGSVADWNPSVINGSVYALALTDNALYIGGEFQSINQDDSQANFAIVDLTMGNVTDNSVGTNERIRSLVIANNQLFMGGDFTEVNGQARKYLAQINLADGLTDLSIDINARVRTIVVNDEATTLWIGGDFTGNTRNKLIKLNLVNNVWNLDSTWILRAQIGDESDTGYSAGDGDVFGMTKIDNTIYIAGSFTQIKTNGTNNPRSFLAAVNATSGAIAPWQPVVSNSVRSLSIINNQIYAAGDFTDGIAAFGLEGNKIDSWSGVNGNVHSLVATNDGVFIGGTFTSSKTTPRSNLVALNADGSLKTDWNAGTESTIEVLDNRVNVLTLHNGNLYIGGVFNKLNGEDRDSFGVVNAATGVLDSFNPDDSPVLVNAFVIKDQTVYVGGMTNNVAKLFSLNLQNGELITSWLSETTGKSINALAISGNTLYVGGEFTKYDNDSDDGNSSDGTDRNNAMAFDLSGAVPALTDWNPNVNGPVNSIAVVEGMMVYLGGSFDQVKGEARTNLATITTNLSGTLLDWNSSTNIVNTLLVVDGSVYVGSENQLASFMISGEELNVIEMDGSVSALYNNGVDYKLHIGGSFTGGYTIGTLFIDR